MKRFKIIFSYDGTNYNGYQKQPGLDTIQGKIEDALFYINNKTETSFKASSRTDSKVHANNQVGHVDICVDITEYKLKRALNSLLPDDIFVKSTQIVKEDFHSRYMTKSKEYIYLLNIGEYNPIQRNYVWQYNKNLDIEAMNEAVKYFIGVHDFSSYSSNEDKKEDCVRTIYDANISEEDGIIRIWFKGSGFLRYMVRIMVGSLVEVGNGKFEPSYIKELIDSKNRSRVGFTASPVGLYLDKVNY